jgi:DtxR family manganese transport transcriptional regulator
MAPRTNSFAKTRRDHAVETAEDYVEAIEDIRDEIDSCRVRDLANRMQVSHVTVTRILSRLESEGLVNRVPYGPVELTSAGRRMARASRERHRLLLDFLLAIGVFPEVAEHDAEGMEHHVSEQTLRAIRRFLAKA